MGRGQSRPSSSGLLLKYIFNGLHSFFIETTIKSVNTTGSKTDKKLHDASLHPKYNLSSVNTLWDGGV
jgi:hypothetical protein